MENTINTNIILGKKMEHIGYDGAEMNNFVADGEITVTITLEEYRKLIRSDATKQSEIEKANKDRYERNVLNEKLKKENDALKTELYELQKKFEPTMGQNPEKTPPDDEIKENRKE